MLRTPLRRTFSRDHLARDARTVVLALVVTSVVMATPSIAAQITNADTVDGKSAVGASASTAQRQGKLVATDSRGRLPSSLIPKARDADRVDGFDSTSLVTTTGSVRAGVIQRGVYSAWGGGAGGYAGETVTLRQPLAAQIPSSRVTVIAQGGAFTTECPGQGQVRPVSWACIYERGAGSRTFDPVFDPTLTGGGNGVGRLGFGIYIDCLGSGCWSYGSWAIRAPRASAPRPGTQPDTQRSPRPPAGRG